MLRFEIITIFPEVFEPYLNSSILARAQKKKLVKFSVHDLRKWAKDKHRTVDDKPYGGGPGMVMKVEPIFQAVSALKKKQGPRNPPPLKLRRASKKQTRVVLFSASGKQFTQRVAERYAKKYDQIIFICGRYEGVDARVGEYIADEEVSIGPYVLTGGEVPAMVVVDAVTRLIPGALGNRESLAEETFSLGPRLRARGASAESRVGSYAEGVSQLGEYPQYTRPEVFYPDAKSKKKAWKVPKVLLSGNHQSIFAWRQSHLR